MVSSRRAIQAAVVIVTIVLVALALWAMPQRLFENHDYINCVNADSKALQQERGDDSLSATKDPCADQFGKYIWSVTFK